MWRAWSSSARRTGSVARVAVTVTPAPAIPRSPASSRCASRNACSGPSTSLAGAPLARVALPARPVGAAATAARRWARRPAEATGGGGTGSTRWPAESHSKMASSAADRAGPSLVANSSAPTASRSARQRPSRHPGRGRRPGSRPHATGRADPSGTRPPPRRRSAPGSASSRPPCRWRAAQSGPGSRPGGPGRRPGAGPPPAWPRRGRSPAGRGGRQAARGAGRPVPPAARGPRRSRPRRPPWPARLSVNSARPAAVR